MGNYLFHYWISGILKSPLSQSSWPFGGQATTMWPLFKKRRALNGTPEAVFNRPITLWQVKKRDKGVCGWKIRAGMRLKSITDRGWMCPGVTSSGVRILSVGTLFCTSIKTIWYLNLTDRIRDVIEMLKELYHGIGVAQNCNLDQIECNGPYWVNRTSYGKIL